MPLFEYVLLAVIGSSGAAGLPATTSGRTFGPEAIVQPNGGALLPEQIGIHKSRNSRRKQRHHKHRHGGRKTYETKKDAGKIT